MKYSVMTMKEESFNSNKTTVGQWIEDLKSNGYSDYDISLTFKGTITSFKDFRKDQIEFASSLEVESSTINNYEKTITIEVK